MKNNKLKKHPLSPFALTTKRSTGFLIVAFLLFSYPVISIVNQPEFIFGIPVLYLYIFILWLAVIIVSSLIINRTENNDNSEL